MTRVSKSYIRITDTLKALICSSPLNLPGSNNFQAKNTSVVTSQAAPVHHPCINLWLGSPTPRLPPATPSAGDQQFLLSVPHSFYGVDQSEMNQKYRFWFCTDFFCSMARLAIWSCIEGSQGLAKVDWKSLKADCNRKLKKETPN